MRFLSDNSGGASPEILDAVVAANSGLEHAYGDDRWSRRLDQVFGEFFGAEVRVFPVATGTAANSLALATVTPPMERSLRTRKRTWCAMNAARPSSSPVARGSSPLPGRKASSPSRV